MVDDLSALANMQYSGRSLIVGMTPDGEQFMGYTLTGRSPPSQARKLKSESIDGITYIRTKVTDPKQLEKGNPALLLYPALVSVNGFLIGSNGAQTDLLVENVKQLLAQTAEDNVNIHTFTRILPDTFAQPVMMDDPRSGGQIDLTTFEPDSPIYTPRISAIVYDGFAGMFIVCNDGGEKRVGDFYFPLRKGKAKLLSTYKGGNENPFPLSFDREPLSLTIESTSVADIVSNLFDAIEGGSKPGENFQVAAAAIKQSSQGTHKSVRNRF